MITFALRRGCVAGAVLFFLGISVPSHAAEPAEEAAPEQKEKVDGSGAEDAKGSEQAEAVPTPDAEKEAAEKAAACKKAAADLAGGDPAALQAMPSGRGEALMGEPTAADLFTCLAVAENDGRFCEALPDAKKGECEERRKLLRELKDSPKEDVKADLVYRLCVKSASEADCQKAKAAVAASDASKCEGLSASLLEFCNALASGDPEKCKGLPAGEERGRCEAYAADDPSRCPKDSVDCQNMSKVFAAVKAEGLTGAGAVDPAAAAAVKGKEACADLVAASERFCSEGK